MKPYLQASLRLMVALFVAGLFCSPVDASATIEGGDAGKGKLLAREKCKACHIPGAEGGTMTPLSKTQRQWERFYAKDLHNKRAPGTWDKINPNELMDIMQFMYDHAADSPQPETCGQ